MGMFPLVESHPLVLSMWSRLFIVGSRNSINKSEFPIFIFLGFIVQLSRLAIISSFLGFFIFPTTCSSSWRFLVFIYVCCIGASCANMYLICCCFFLPIYQVRCLLCFILIGLNVLWILLPWMPSMDGETIEGPSNVGPNSRIHVIMGVSHTFPYFHS